MKRIDDGKKIIFTSDKTYKEIGGDLVNDIHKKRVMDKLVKDVADKLKEEWNKKDE